MIFSHYLLQLPPHKQQIYHALSTRNSWTVQLFNIADHRHPSILCEFLDLVLTEVIGLDCEGILCDKLELTFDKLGPTPAAIFHQFTPLPVDLETAEQEKIRLKLLSGKCTEDISIHRKQKQIFFQPLKIFVAQRNSLVDSAKSQIYFDPFAVQLHERWTDVANFEVLRGYFAE